MRLIEHALDTPGCRGVFNAVAPTPVTHREMQQTVARTLRRPLWLRVPAFVPRACLGEMAELLVDGQRVVPARAVAAGFSFRYPLLQDALDHLIGAGTQNRYKTPAEIYYNGECPVCRATMTRYAGICADASTDLQFIDATGQAGSLAACGLRREHLERRLYLRDAEGRVLSGMPALIELWSRLPGHRWLSVLFGAPLLRQLSSIAYDQVVAPGLAFWARRRARV